MKRTTVKQAETALRPLPAMATPNQLPRASENPAEQRLAVQHGVAEGADTTGDHEGSVFE